MPVVDTERTVILFRCRTEQEAALVVGLLAAEGIKAASEGALTSAMRAEVPQDVSVRVFEADLERARACVQSHRTTPEGRPSAGLSPAGHLIWTLVVALMMGLPIVIYAIGQLTK